MQMNNPKITVITVSYNVLSTIEKTILSVINQTYRNIEYIIIDGGSSDGTVDIIKKYEDKLAYWISEPDNGIYDAINKGIDKANGEWVATLNSGDTYLDNNVIDIIVENITDFKSSTDIFHGKIKMIYDNSRAIERTPQKAESLYRKMCLFHPTCFVRAELYKIRRYNIKYKIASDYDFLRWCLINNYKFHYIDSVIVNFAVGGISDTTIFNTDAYHIWKNDFGYLKSYIYFLRDLIPKIFKYPIKILYKKIYL